MPKNSKLSKKIKELRLSKNMSQERFGRKIGVSGKSVSAYETGVCSPTLKVMESISAVYEIPLINGDKQDNLLEKLNNIKYSLKELEDILNKSLSL